MHDVWADFAASPIITHFQWSPLVELAFDNNRELFAPTTVFEPPLSTLPYTSNAERYTEMKGLLALHVRRGDYAIHCDRLANFSSTFLSFNSLSGLEPFHVPPGGGWNENSPENMALYRRHCFPTVEQIVTRVREVQRSESSQGLESVYIMTNGAVSWVDELKLALLDTGIFKHVSSSRDTVLNWEQKYVAQAMDMLVGQRAQVFIGNGVSFQPLPWRCTSLITPSTVLVVERDWGSCCHAAGERVSPRYYAFLLGVHSCSHFFGFAAQINVTQDSFWSCILTYRVPVSFPHSGFVVFIPLSSSELERSLRDPNTSLAVRVRIFIRRLFRWIT